MSTFPWNCQSMKNLFTKQEVSKRRKNNLEIPSQNTVKYGDKNIRSLGPHILNGLPEEIKNENSYDKFKEYLNAWYGPKCACSLCSTTEIYTQIETKIFSVNNSLMITLIRIAALGFDLFNVLNGL